MANNVNDIHEEMTPELKKQFADFTLKIVPLFQALLQKNNDAYAEAFLHLWQSEFVDDTKDGVQFLSWLLVQHYVIQKALFLAHGKNMVDELFNQETIAAMISSNTEYYDIAYPKVKKK